MITTVYMDSDRKGIQDVKTVQKISQLVNKRHLFRTVEIPRSALKSTSYIMQQHTTATSPSVF